MASASDAIEKRGFWSRIAPGITLMVLAPLIAEILPGATRFSSLQYAVPSEIVIWGGGALMIRAAVRRAGLGWANMALLALALAIAEEWVVQQTSIAPLVTHTLWGRAGGVNYVYFLWAVVYEAVLVVFVPVMLVELLYPVRRREVWLSKAGLAAILLLSVPASYVAWFGWNRIARINFFKMEPYSPPMVFVGGAVLAILLLILVALGPTSKSLARLGKPIAPPAPLLVGLAGVVWAGLTFVLEMLAFGVGQATQISAPAVTLAGLVVVGAMLVLVPGWSLHPRWKDAHRGWLVAGCEIGMMAALFTGFSDTMNADLIFKIVSDAIGAVLLVWLALKVSRRPAA